MTLEELQVIIEAETSGFKEELASVKAQLGGLNTSVSSSTKSIFNSFKGLKTAIAALGIGKVIKDSIMSGMEAVESENLFEVSMGGMANSARAWSEELQDSLGLNAYELRKNVGTLFNMTTSMGLSQDAAYGLSTGLTELANDMASFYNLSTEEAFTKLRSGITGEAEPLKALGILVDDATIKQAAYRNGIAAVGAELTQQQKVQARYLAIMEQTKNAQGDLARTIDSPANQLRILKTQLELVKINLGMAFLPIAQVVLPLLNDFTQGLAVVTTNVAQLSQALFGKTAATSSGTTTTNAAIKANNNLASSYTNAGNAAKKASGGLAAWDEINKLNSSNSSSGTGGISTPALDTATGGLLGGLGQSSVEVSKEVQKMVDAINKIPKERLEQMKDIAVSVLEAVVTIKGAGGLAKLLGFSSSSGIFAGGGLLAGLGGLAEGLSSFFGSAGGMNLSAMLGDMIIGPIDEYLKEHLPEKLYDGLAGGILGFSSGGVIGALIGILGGPVGMLGGAIAGALIGAIIGAFKDEIGDFFKTTMDECFNWDATCWWFDEAKKSFEKGGVNILLGIVQGFEGAISFFVEPIDDFFNWLWEDICAVFGIHSPATSMEPIGRNIVFGIIEGFWSGIQSSSFYQLGSNIIGSIRDGLSGGWSELKSWWSSLSLSSFSIKTPHLSWSYGSKASGWIYDILDALSLPTSLPKLNVSWYAKGGFPQMGEMFVANEDGPEMIGRIGNRNAVANNDQIVQAVSNGVYNAVIAAMGGATGGKQGNINLALELIVGGTKFGRVCINAINEAQDEAGKTLIRI